MTDELWLWLTFILLGLTTTLPRAGFIVAGNRVSLPATLQRALRYAPAAALAAIVVPDVLVVGGELPLARLMSDNQRFGILPGF